MKKKANVTERAERKKSGEVEKTIELRENGKMAKKM